MSLDLETHDKPDPQALNPDERAEVNEEIAHLRRAIASLPESQRLVVVLRYYACLREVEVAQVLGIPVGTVKSRLRNAKRVLRRTLSTSSSTDLRAGL